MNKNKKKPGLFDFIIIIAILGAIAVVVWYFSNNNVGDSAASTGKTPVTYTVEITDVNQDADERIIIGDAVYDSVSGNEIGTVENAQIVNQWIDGYDAETNTMTLTDDPGVYSLHLTISAYADVTESATTVNDIDVMSGAKVTLRTSTFGGEGYCIQLEEPEL